MKTNKRPIASQYAENCNQRNKHQNDARITFEEASHTYTVGGRQLKPVSELIKEAFPKFNADNAASYKAWQRGVSKQTIFKEWEEIRDLGTKMHGEIERYFLGNSIEEWEKDETYHRFEMFVRDVKLSPYRTEWTIFDEEYGLAGTLDFLDYQDGVFTIYDWKRTDKIIKNGEVQLVNTSKKHAKRPICHISDTRYWHYALQLNLYCYMLQKNYGINIQKLRLAIFHPSYDNYYMLEMPFLSTEVESILEKYCAPLKEVG